MVSLWNGENGSRRQIEAEVSVPLGLGKVGSLGLGTGQQPGFAQSACMLPQSTEQPDLGSKQLVVRQLEQQLLAFSEAAVVVPALDLAPL